MNIKRMVNHIRNTSHTYHINNLVRMTVNKLRKIILKSVHDCIRLKSDLKIGWEFSVDLKKNNVLLKMYICISIAN